MTKKLIAFFSFIAVGFFLVVRHEEQKAALETELWHEAAHSVDES
ncbi:MAG: hypothetical protein ACRCWS_07625 [Propionibacteriaceae bacterium]